MAVDEKESALRSAELRLERRSEPFDTPRRRQILEHINDAQKRHGTARTRLERARAATQQQAAMLRELSTTRQMVEEDLLRTVRDVPGGSDATPKTLAHLRQETRAGLHRPRDWPDRGLWMAAFDDEEKCISQLEAARRARDAIRGELRSSQRQEEEWTSRLKIAEEAAWRAEARKVEREREELNKRRQAADRLADAAEEAQQREARRRRDRRAVHQHRLDEVMAVMRALVRVAKSGGGHTMRQLRPGILGMICPREREVTMQIEVGRGAGLTVTARLDVARRDLEQRAQVSARFDGCLLGLRQVTLAYVDSSDAIVTVSQDLPGPGWTLTPLATTESAEILAGAVLAAIFEVQTHWHQWGVEVRGRFRGAAVSPWGSGSSAFFWRATRGHSEPPKAPCNPWRG